VTFATFWPALSADWVDWDDTDNYLRNAMFRGLDGERVTWMWTTFHMGHYQPLTWMSLGLDYALSGMNARGYHATNVVLHALNAVLFFVVARALVRVASATAESAARRADPPSLTMAAALAALLFAVHPLRAEPVAWISERRDVLSAFWYLLTVWAYLRAQRARRERRLGWLILALVLFLLCNLSKVIGVTLPVVFLLLDWYPLRRIGGSAGWFTPRAARVVVEKVPFLVVAAVFAVVAYLGQSGRGWTVPLAMHPVPGRIGVVAFGLAFHVWKSVWPLNLHPIYELHLPVVLTQARFLVPLVTVPVVLIALFALRRRWPGLWVAALAYVVLLLPASGIIQNGWQLTHDRYSYLATMGLAVVAAGALLGVHSAAARPQPVRVAVAGLIVLALAGLTWRQARVWHNTETLWTHAVLTDPHSSNAQNGYGFVLYERARQAEAAGDKAGAQRMYAEAVNHLRLALSIRRLNEKAHINLWNALKALGRTEELEEAYREGTQVEPVAAEAWNGLGIAAYDRKDYAAAEDCFARAIELSPNHDWAWFNRGNARNALKRTEEAIKDYQQALRVAPQRNSARLNLALIYEKQNRLEEALRLLIDALRQDPNYAKAKTAFERVRDKLRGQLQPEGADSQEAEAAGGDAP
jgi:tetratricopeptide (TPR) repeat protein